MEIRDKQGEAYQVNVLSKGFADKEWKQILDIGNTIPWITWSKEYLLAEKDEYRVYRGKWEHSLVVLNEEKTWLKRHGSLESQRPLGKRDLRGQAVANQAAGLEKSGQSSPVEVVAILIAFEREPKGPVYKSPSFYIHLFAVKESFRGKGIGTALMELFLERCKPGFKHLEGRPAVTVQTNSEDFNQGTISFYRKLGFKRIGRKVYRERVDFIMGKEL